MSQHTAKQRHERAYAAAVLGGCVIERWPTIPWRWGAAPRPTDKPWRLTLPSGLCDNVHYPSRYRAACAGIKYLTGEKVYHEPERISHGTYTGRLSQHTVLDAGDYLHGEVHNEHIVMREIDKDIYKKMAEKIDTMLAAGLASHMGRLDAPNAAQKSATGGSGPSTEELNDASTTTSPTGWLQQD